ncbi:MAG: adenosylcobinamide-GDP ribazoletransferase [Candidatus Omnitrophica bacterium]|nr:adenosylcobinamide-GDP ribazoletransferase [Candidatus Omnitrophota bacterium]
MISFLLALQFLTIIPIKIPMIDQEKFSRAMIYFPLVGLFLGFILFGINSLFSFLDFAQISIDIILVISLAALSGGMHLDGLSDSFDAFLSRKSKDQMLEIMRDSHAGVMGVLSIISVILLKIALLYAIPASLIGKSLLLLCIFSRWAMVFTMFLFPYARQEGKAKAFIENINIRVIIIATLITLAAALLILQINGLIVFALIAISVFFIGKLINKTIGGITGDTLGAINEITEVITLFAITILGRIFG